MSSKMFNIENLFIQKCCGGVYLNLYWLYLINEVLCHSPESDFIASAQATILDDEFENYTFKIIAASPMG